TQVTRAGSSWVRPPPLAVHQQRYPASSPATERIPATVCARSLPTLASPAVPAVVPECAINEAHSHAPARADQRFRARVCECAGDGIDRADLPVAALPDTKPRAALHHHSPGRRPGGI